MNGIDYFQMTPGMSMVRVTEKQRIDILMLISKILFELSIEIKNFGVEIVLRKLLLSLMSVQLAQNIGVDHHAATEELYYYMKKNEDTSIIILEFIDKIIKINNGNHS